MIDVVVSVDAGGAKGGTESVHSFVTFFFLMASLTPDPTQSAALPPLAALATASERTTAPIKSRTTAAAVGARNGKTSNVSRIRPLGEGFGRWPHFALQEAVTGRVSIGETQTTNFH